MIASYPEFKRLLLIYSNPLLKIIKYENSHPMQAAPDGCIIILQFFSGPWAVWADTKDMNILY